MTVSNPELTPHSLSTTHSELLGLLKKGINIFAYLLINIFETAMTHLKMSYM